MYYMGKKIRTHLLREREQALHTDEKGIQEDGPGCIPRRSGHGVMVDLQEPQKAVVKNQSCSVYDRLCKLVVTWAL